MIEVVLSVFGPASTAALAAAFVYGSFEFIERVSSRAAHSAFSRWLKRVDLASASAGLPGGTIEVFKRVFGEKHLSVRCFCMSVVFTLAGLALTYALQTGLVHRMLEFEDERLRDLMIHSACTYFVLGILVDYINLYKARQVLPLLKKKQKRSSLALLVLIDFMLSYVIAGMVMEIAATVVYFSFPSNASPSSEFSLITDDFSITETLLAGGLRTLFLIPTLLPTIWLWLYLGAAGLTKSFVASRPSYYRLVWFLDVDKAPFRSAGIVASPIVYLAVAVVSGVTKLAS